MAMPRNMKIFCGLVAGSWVDNLFVKIRNPVSGKNTRNKKFPKSRLSFVMDFFVVFSNCPFSKLMKRTQLNNRSNKNKICHLAMIM